MSLLVCFGSSLTNWRLSLKVSVSSPFLPGWTRALQFFWMIRSFAPWQKSITEAQPWLPFATTCSVGLWSWPRVSVRNGSERIFRWEPLLLAVSRPCTVCFVCMLCEMLRHHWAKSVTRYLPMYLRCAHIAEKYNDRNYDWMENTNQVFT